MSKLYDKEGKKVLIDTKEFNVSDEEFSNVLKKLEPACVGENENFYVYLVTTKRKIRSTIDKVPTLFIINKYNFDDMHELVSWDFSDNEIKVTKDSVLYDKSMIKINITKKQKLTLNV